MKMELIPIHVFLQLNQANKGFLRQKLLLSKWQNNGFRFPSFIQIVN